jgi:hypothetical protein
MQRMELCTPHQSLAAAIRIFAHAVTRDGVSFVSEHPVAEGEWVAFRFLYGRDVPLLEGEGLCCEIERFGSHGAPRYRIALAALELDGENRARHVRLFAERMRHASGDGIQTSEMPTVRVSRPITGTFGAAPDTSVDLHAEGYDGEEPAARRCTTDVVPKESPYDDSEATSVQEVMLLAVKAELLDHAGELLEKVTRMQGGYPGRPTSVHALLEHALLLGLTVLDTQLNAYPHSA